jgi:hypothetical protein
MINRPLCLLAILTLLISNSLRAEGGEGNFQPLKFKGQASIWSNFNPSNNLELWGGAQYLPQLNLKFGEESKSLLDFEATANLNGTLGSYPFDTIYSKGSIKPYRLWARYSTEQLEIRVGLQKINFGSATMIRPLMWFDKIDPRDPLQLTDGVWGILGRYYFLNNANLWLWVLYGNKNPKTWEFGNTSQDQPEFGGRFQTPVPKGEMGLSFHHRLSDTRSLVSIATSNELIPENRIGIDGKWDLGVGLWFEAVWMKKSRNIGALTNQTSLCAGTDYTFRIGNGLNVIVEQLLFAYSEKPFRMNDPFVFSTLSLSYPVSMNDNLSAMVYYDWINKGVYNIATWNHQFNNLIFYCMGYSNPKNYKMPLTANDVNLFAGTGVQVMVVWNH